MKLWRGVGREGAGDIMILLIDDNDNERAIIRKMLESGGHEVREATGGDDGLVQFGALAPALVLCDLMMPMKDGFATIADIQSLSPKARIIAMSGVWYGPADHAEMAKSLGLKAVIEKPFDRTQLLELVSRTLRPPKKAAAKARPQAKAKSKKAKPKAKAKPKRAAAKAKRPAKSRPKVKKQARKKN
jgi:DNA-binding NtrC family response regulator